MKKIMIIVFVISFTLIGTISAGDLGYGAKAGLNLATVTGEDVDEEAKIKPGLTIGGFATYPLGNKLTIRPEVLFTQKGYRYKESDEGYDFKGKVKMNWLDIPILAVYQVAEGIKAFVGPYFDLYLGGEYVTKIEGGGESMEFDEKIEGEDVNSLGMGLIFGGAYGVCNNVEVEGRIELGLTSKDPDYTVKNFGIQFVANYYLKK
jgi:hypothetical protein